MEQCNNISYAEGLLGLIALNCAVILKDFYLSLQCVVQAFSNIVLYALTVSPGSNPPQSQLSTAKHEVKIVEKPQSSSITENGVRLSKNMDDELTMEEVSKVLRNLGAPYGLHNEKLQGEVSSSDIAMLFEEQEPSLQEVKEAFLVFDENNDSFIDAKELKRVVSALGFQEVSETDCKRMIRAYDTNGDELIDFHEFIRLVANSFD